MLSLSVLLVFIPTFFFVSLTPGLCMTLALTMGMTVGIRRTLWMIIGELTGVAIVATASVVGIATMMLQYPTFFQLFKIAGGIYLLYLGLSSWLTKGEISLASRTSEQQKTGYELAMQGFITAIANPKGWAFFVALLPPFIDQSHPIAPQLSILVAIILTLECTCLLLYASGGKILYKALEQSGYSHILNRISGTLMIVLACWLVMF